MSKKIRVDEAPLVEGSAYPSPYDEPCRLRSRRRIGDAAQLSQFGANLTRLPPGAWSSQRHWHTAEDELVLVIEGEVVLVTDSGEETLRAGDFAGFKAGEPDGHHLQNRSGADAVFLEIGARRPSDDEVFYPDIDLRAVRNRAGYVHRDGTAYPDAKPRHPAPSGGK